MVLKAEQERIRHLLRDTITLLCRNGLTFKTQFNIEALIGITLDEEEIMLVNINECIRPGVSCYQNSSEDDGQGSGYQDGYSPGRSGGRRRRRRKRSLIKTEPTQSDEDSTYRGASSLLDLSTGSYRAGRTIQIEPIDDAPPSKKTCGDGESSKDAEEQSVGASVMSEEPEPHTDELDEDMKSAVIVKKEYTDDSWPPAGVMQEVTVGGSDTNSEPSYPPYSTHAALHGSFRSSDLVSASLLSPGSPSRTHPGLPGLPMLNGLPFPTLSLPQSHFAQALGRLVGGIPAALQQQMGRPPSREVTPSKSTTTSHSSGTSPSLYSTNTRSSLPKEAVAMMSDWLRKNQHNPYPTDDIKDEMVRTTNLSYNQINYWFTNARRRLLPKWELQRKVEEQQLAERLGQGQRLDTDETNSIS